MSRPHSEKRWKSPTSSSTHDALGPLNPGSCSWSTGGPGLGVRTQVDVGQHPVQELRLHAVRRQEVCQQLTVTELWMLQEPLQTNTHTDTHRHTQRDF